MTKINKKTRALWIGRFQPFHFGHMHVLKNILEDYSFVTIVIGSAQEDYTLQNPLTAKERIWIIKKVMESVGAKSSQYKLVVADDIATNSLWALHISRRSGKFDEVVTSSPLTKILFEDSGFKAVENCLYSRKLYSGTEIRRRILKGKAWERLVPASVFIALQKIDIVRRIKEIERSDNPYI